MVARQRYAHLYLTIILLSQRGLVGQKPVLVELFPVRRQGGTGTLDRVSTEGRRKSRILVRGHRQRPGEFGTEQFERFSNGRRHGHPGRLRSEYNYYYTSTDNRLYIHQDIIYYNSVVEWQFYCFTRVSFFVEIGRSQIRICDCFHVTRRSPRLLVLGKYWSLKPEQCIDYWRQINTERLYVYSINTYILSMEQYNKIIQYKRVINVDFIGFLFIVLLQFLISIFFLIFEKCY